MLTSMQDEFTMSAQQSAYSRMELIVLCKTSLLAINVSESRSPTTWYLVELYRAADTQFPEHVLQYIVLELSLTWVHVAYAVVTPAQRHGHHCALPVVTWQADAFAGKNGRGSQYVGRTGPRNLHSYEGGIREGEELGRAVRIRRGEEGLLR